MSGMVLAILLLKKAPTWLGIQSLAKVCRGTNKYNNIRIVFKNLNKKGNTAISLLNFRIIYYTNAIVI